MSELSDKIEFDKPYELKIGNTFKNDSKLSYHQFKCKDLMKFSEFSLTIFCLFKTPISR